MRSDVAYMQLINMCNYYFTMCADRISVRLARRKTPSISEWPDSSEVSDRTLVNLLLNDRSSRLVSLCHSDIRLPGNCVSLLAA